MNVSSFLLVGVGSAIGGMLRYGVGFLMRPVSGFPCATFTVNIVGSLLLGVFSGLIARHSAESGWGLVRCFAVVGVCGGFTTFSTFSNETFCMLENAQWILALLYLGGSILGGLLAVGLGYFISR